MTSPLSSKQDVVTISRKKYTLRKKVGAPGFELVEYIDVAELHRLADIHNKQAQEYWDRFRKSV